MADTAKAAPTAAKSEAVRDLVAGMTNASFLPRLTK
jgi:hypothetical protein